MCSSPRKPHRKPKPKAALLSGVQVRLASLSWSFSMASRSSSYSSVSTGKMPAHTMGFTSSKPLMASAQGRCTWVMVSPTFTSLAVLMPLMM